MAKPPKPKIIIGMPAYNEEKYIGTMVLKARLYGDEVLVVDDGSVDRTAKIAQLAGATVIRYKEHRGKGAAIQSILAEANKRNPDTLVLIDADSQHDPEDIPLFVKAISWGSDLVIGSRVRRRSNIPLYRRFGQRVLSYLSRILSGEKVTDSECGFRALSPKAIAKLELRQNGFAIETEMIAVATDKGLAVTEVPISALYTKDGSTLNPAVHGLGNLVLIINMISERRPLFFFGLGGSILAALGLIAGVRTLNILSVEGILPTGTVLLSVLLLTIGIFSMFTGIILHALARRKE